jgi:addiction module HigA family antidote
MKLRSQTTTRAARSGAASGRGALAGGRRLPRNRPPTHPGEMLLEEFLKPLGISQSELAAHLGVSFPRLNEIVRGRRGVTPDTALRLARVLGMPADFWLGLQIDWDLWHALHGKNAEKIERLEPVHGNG